MPSCDIASLEKQLDDLAQERGMSFNVDKPLELLQDHHISDFSGDALFDTYARTICLANSIPRREIFEAWSMASFIHQYFPPYQRIADLACGHGLVSWALLLMSLSEANSEMEQLQNSQKSFQRSVVCIDKLMPESADNVQQVMITEYPQLANRWDYVEERLESILPHQSTILVGIHCCGTLSDTVIDFAIKAKSSVALAPCCHTMSCVPSHQYEQLQIALQEDKNCTLANYVDNQRIERLRSAGYQVSLAHIPAYLAPRNQIILASHPSSTKRQQIAAYELTMNPEVSTQGKHISLLPSDDNRCPSDLISIPVEDSPQARATVRKLAGGEAAMYRKAPVPPSLCLSLLFPQKRNLPVSRISNLANRDLDLLVMGKVDPEASVSRCIYAEVAAVAIEKTPGVGSKYGLTERAFRVCYMYRNKASSYKNGDDENDENPDQASDNGDIPTCYVRKGLAKFLFDELCRRIQREVFGSSDVRHIPSTKS